MHISKFDRRTSSPRDESSAHRCGATFDVEDGAPQPSAEGAGKPLFGALLKAKPQRSLLVFENRELKDGSVYVNVTPKSKQLFEDESE